MTELNFTLPWPPSINRMYSQGVIGGKNKRARASMFLSDVGKAYRLEALVAINNMRVPKGILKGRLAVQAIAHPADARVRDLDNLWKSALDVLKHNGVIDDDGFIDDLHIKRGAKAPTPHLEIRISEITEAFDSRQEGLDLKPGATTPMPGNPF